MGDGIVLLTFSDTTQALAIGLRSILKGTNSFFMKICSQISRVRFDRYFVRTPSPQPICAFIIFRHSRSSSQKFLKEFLGIEALDSVLFMIREPPWRQARPAP